MLLLENRIIPIEDLPALPNRLPIFDAGATFAKDVDRTVLCLENVMARAAIVGAGIGLDYPELVRARGRCEDDGNTFDFMAHMAETLTPDQIAEHSRRFISYDSAAVRGISDWLPPTAFHLLTRKEQLAAMDLPAKAADLLYPDAAELDHALKGTPDLYVTYAINKPWQHTKLVGGGIRGFAHITDAAQKGPAFATYKDEMTGLFSFIAMDAEGNPVAKIRTPRLYLIDDKQDATEGSPEGVQLIYLRRPEEPPLESQQRGQLPPDAITIGDLQFDTIRGIIPQTTWRPANERAARRPDLQQKVSSFAPACFFSSSVRRPVRQGSLTDALQTIPQLLK